MSSAGADAVARAVGHGWSFDAVEVLDADELWFTGKLVARVRLDGELMKVSRHPRPGDAGLVRALGYQRALAGVTAVADVAPARDGRLVYDDGADLWAVSRWLTGEPVIAQDEWTAAMLEQAGSGVAALHAAGASLVDSSEAVPSAPERYWTGDWDVFFEWVQRSWDELSTSVDVATSSALAPLRALIDETIGDVGGWGSRWHGRQRLITVTHDDLWTAHLLWDDGPALTGIVDLDGLAAGYAIGDLAALMADFADLEPAPCRAVLRGYSEHLPVRADDLEDVVSIVVRHHLLVLVERVRLWRDQPTRRDDLLGPVGFWLRSLRTARTLDAHQWAHAVLHQ